MPLATRMPGVGLIVVSNGMNTLAAILPDAANTAVPAAVHMTSRSKPAATVLHWMTASATRAVFHAGPAGARTEYPKVKARVPRSPSSCGLGIFGGGGAS
jgi:hypothetical protein